MADVKNTQEISSEEDSLQLVNFSEKRKVDRQY